jgi:uncharacterized protein YbjQ (UPF0145 family)
VREFPGFQFFRAVELQVRGVIHLHVIVWSPGRRITATAVQPLALAAGFGCNVKVTHSGEDVARFARYVTKYVTKSVDGRGDCPWDVLDPVTGELRASAATYKAWSQSLGFGCRMREHEDAIRSQRRRAAERLRLAADAGHAEAVGLVLGLLGGSLLTTEGAPNP